MKELQYPVRPGRYRHFKGNEYQVLGVARHSETEEAALRQAKSQREAAANHLMLLYSAEQTPCDGTDSTL